MPSTLYVIIADDDDSIRGLIARVVARTYPAVTMSVVTNGLDALLIYDQQGADLLITNNDMPGLRGLSLVEALRVLRSASLPILMISADRTIEERALALGVNLFLVKPFTLAQLAGALTKLLPL
jgi:CheY-like chemotaxis protein